MAFALQLHALLQDLRATGQAQYALGRNGGGEAGGGGPATSPPSDPDLTPRFPPCDHTSVFPVL